MRPAAVREHRGDVAPHAADAGALERCVPEAALERLRIPVEQRREIRLDNIGAHAELVVARRARELHVPRTDVLTHVASEQPLAHVPLRSASNGRSGTRSASVSTTPMKVNEPRSGSISIMFFPIQPSPARWASSRSGTGPAST